MTHADDLRAWAKGMYTIEAATELLIRGFGGKFSAPGNPWVHTSSETQGPGQVSAWIDFAAIRKRRAYSPVGSAGFCCWRRRWLRMCRWFWVTLCQALTGRTLTLCWLRSRTPAAVTSTQTSALRRTVP